MKVSGYFLQNIFFKAYMLLTYSMRFHPFLEYVSYHSFWLIGILKKNQNVFSKKQWEIKNNIISYRCHENNMNYTNPMIYLNGTRTFYIDNHIYIFLECNQHDHSHHKRKIQYNSYWKKQNL